MITSRQSCIVIKDKTTKFSENLSSRLNMLFKLNVSHVDINELADLENADKNLAVVFSYRFLVGLDKKTLIKFLSDNPKLRVIIWISHVFDVEKSLNGITEFEVNHVIENPANEKLSLEFVKNVYFEMVRREKRILNTPSKSLKSTLEKREVRSLRSRKVFKPEILAIGSSTGGPQALLSFFTEFKRYQINTPIVITQHMPEKFTAILAGQIHKATGIKTFEAKDNMPIEKNYIYIAPGGRHLLIKKKNGQLFTSLNDGPAENFCKPSVDPMLRSLECLDADILVCIFTGMGKDGVEGVKYLKKLDKAKAYVQDEASSVVWGMPGAVAKAGFADKVGTPKEIAGFASSAFKGSGK